MCFFTIKNVGIILIISLCSSVVMVYNTKIMNPPDSQHLVNLINVVPGLLYNSPERLDKIIIFYDKYNKISSKFVKNLESKNSIVILNKYFSWKKKIIHVKKIDAVILFINMFNNEKLTKTLSDFLNTPWKSPTPIFFIIYNHLDNCVFAEKFLSIMWNFRIISYFICQNKLKDTRIFTFNPFSKWAPVPWQIVYTKKYEHTNWTLLVQKYNKKYIMKSPLHFDRIKVLDGYKLIAGYAIQIKNSTSETKKHKCEPNPWDWEYMHAIAMTLNLPLKIMCLGNPFINSNSKKELAKQIFQSKVDIMGTPLSINREKITVYNFEHTFPTFHHQWGILTINRGYKTPVEKIQDFYGIWVLLYTIFILLVTFIVIYLFEQRRTYFAVLEVIRLLINSSLYTKMNTVALRMFFTIIFIYFLIIQATFNGNLTNFLTKPVLKNHPETLEDLKDLGYDNIYGLHSLKYSMTEDINFTSTNTCWNKLENKANVACIDNHNILRLRAWKNRTLFHSSQKSFGFFFHYYYARTNLPLLDKVNQAIMRIWQSGLQLHWEKKSFSRKLLKIKVFEATSLFIWAPIKLDNLIFAFIILGSGLICATIAFFIELRNVYRYKNCIKNK